MQAKDVMTAKVVSVSKDTLIHEAVGLLLKYRISARRAAALACGQNDPRPPHMLLPAVAISYHRAQSLTVGGTHLDLDPLAHRVLSHASPQYGIL